MRCSNKVKSTFGVLYVPRKRAEKAVPMVPTRMGPRTFFLSAKPIPAKPKRKPVKRHPIDIPQMNLLGFQNSRKARSSSFEIPFFIHSWKKSKVPLEDSCCGESFIQECSQQRRGKQRFPPLLGKCHFQYPPKELTFCSSRIQTVTLFAFAIFLTEFAIFYYLFKNSLGNPPKKALTFSHSDTFLLKDSGKLSA